MKRDVGNNSEYPYSLYLHTLYSKGLLEANQTVTLLITLPYPLEIMCDTVLKPIHSGWIDQRQQYQFAALQTFPN